MAQCGMIVPTMPGVGDADRSPPPHQCKRPAYADGYCKTHSERWQAHKREEQLRREAGAELRRVSAATSPIDAAIDAAIVLLVNSGYRVEKIAT